MIRKAFKVTVFAICLYFGYVFLVPYDYSIDNAVVYLNEHAETSSHNMCALYVERAINAGGQPAFILPAWGYAYVLPHMGFNEIERIAYKPMKGDIVVFPRVRGHIFGHIAMYNGRQWISDFKQHSLIVNSAYTHSDYRYFRPK